jgi:TRAP-type C4-dicarboxylate transport system permease small subunit
MIRRLLDALYLGAGYLAGLFLIAIFLIMMTLSVGREIGFNLKSGDDIASWCMAAMAFLGLAHCRPSPR